MKEFELQLKLRNNRIKARRKKLGLSLKALAEAAKVSYSTLCAYESMKKSPLVKTRIAGKRWSSEPDSWSKAALDLAIFFECPCEELWPDAVLAVKKPESVTEVSAPQLAKLAGFEEQRLLEAATPPPDEVAASSELSEAIDGLLKTLTPREEKVLRLRFGLGDEDEHTHEGTGEIVGRLDGMGPLSHEQTRQIESKALRKLRHPGRSKYLVSFVKPECVGTLKLKGPKCARCASDFIWEGTKEWAFPVCYDCWVYMDRPEEEPDLGARYIRWRAREELDGPPSE